MSRIEAAKLAVRSSVLDLRLIVMAVLLAAAGAIVWWLLQPAWITIEQIEAHWYPERLRIVVERSYRKHEQCPELLGWDIYVEERATGLVRGPFRRTTPSIHPTSALISGVPLNVPWSSLLPPPRRVMVHVHCLADTEEGIAELDGIRPPQRAPIWTDVQPAWNVLGGKGPP